MTRAIILSAVMTLILGTGVSHAQVNIAGVTVKGTVIDGADCCTVQLVVQLTNIGPNNGANIKISGTDQYGIIGYSCPDARLTYDSGCVSAPGRNPVSIGVFYKPYYPVPVDVPVTIGIEYGDPGKTVMVHVVPQGPGGICETCKTCPACQGSKPINFTNGNTWIEQTDIRPLSGIGNGIQLVRTWNSRWPAELAVSAVGMFGANWRSTYEERVFVGSDATLKYARGDGGLWSFAFGASGWVATSPADPNARIVYTNSGWILTFANGEQRIFDPVSGGLLTILDRNGNATQVTYDSAGRIVDVVDPASRHLTFTYASQTSVLVTTVNSDVGYSASYAYDNSGRLTQVTEPDSSTLSFEYDANSLISAVKDAAGKILESHTYDSNNRGLTSSRAGGVGAITVTYPVSQ